MQKEPRFYRNCDDCGSVTRHTRVPQTVIPTHGTDLFRCNDCKLLWKPEDVEEETPKVYLDNKKDRRTKWIVHMIATDNMMLYSKYKKEHQASA
jgi:uncharacterized Zn finger protein